MNAGTAWSTRPCLAGADGVQRGNNRGATEQDGHRADGRAVDDNAEDRAVNDDNNDDNGDFDDSNDGRTYE